MVVESEMTREEVIVAFETSLPDGGWRMEWAAQIADDNLEIVVLATGGQPHHAQVENSYLRGALLRYGHRVA